MESSIRYSGSSKSLRFHAKEKFPIDSNTYFQVHGVLDTQVGAPTYASAMLRTGYPQLSASLGVGLQYDPQENFVYTVRAKKSFPVTENGSLSFNIKGRCDADKQFKERKGKSAVEWTWSILDIQKNQDIRFKVGYEMFDKAPYLQIRENNWTLNADTKGRWNVRFDL